MSHTLEIFKNAIANSEELIEIDQRTNTIYIGGSPYAGTEVIKIKSWIGPPPTLMALVLYIVSDSAGIQGTHSFKKMCDVFGVVRFETTMHNVVDAELDVANAPQLHQRITFRKRPREEDAGGAEVELTEAQKKVWVSALQGERRLDDAMVAVVQRRMAFAAEGLLPVTDPTTVHLLTDPLSYEKRKGPSAQAHRVVRLALEELRQQPPEMAAQESSSLPAPTVRPPTERLPQTYYILVPEAQSTRLNMVNVQKFLNDAQWYDPTPESFFKRKKVVEVHPSKILPTLEPKTRDKFMVIDDIGLLKTKEDWDHVVAAFVSGRPWQFRGWFKKEEGTTTAGEREIASHLSRLVAFHLCLDEERMLDSIRHWNVQVLKITKRETNSHHRDLLMARQVWEGILAFIEKKRR